MSAAASLGVVAAILAVTLGVGVLGVRSVRMDAAQFIVGGRSLGSVFLWLLLAGEIYTSFTFLGAAGWAYGRGAPAFYILCYGTVAYVISYFMLPPIWRIAREHGLLTGADFFVNRYGSKLLGGLVALVGLVFLVPYITLQLTGAQILLEIAGYGSLNSVAVVGSAFGLIALFTYFGGLRGAAWTSVVKDVLVLAAVVFAGVAIPIHFFGSPSAVVARVMSTHPGWLTLGAPGAPNGSIWFTSTVLLTACGFFMFPQSLAAVYAARDENVLRRNAIFLPFYQLMIVLVYFAGFTALLVLPGLVGPAADRSFILVVAKYYPPWVLGFVAGAGMLAAFVPASAQILGAASIVAKNVLVDYGIVNGEAQQVLATRVLVLVVAALAFAFWAVARTSLVGLGLIAYNGMTQLFPGVVLALSERTRPGPLPVALGILAGIAVLAYVAIAKASIPGNLNAGTVALAVNCVALGAAQALAFRRTREAHV